MCAAHIAPRASCRVYPPHRLLTDAFAPFSCPQHRLQGTGTGETGKPGGHSGHSSHLGPGGGGGGKKREKGGYGNFEIDFD